MVVMDDGDGPMLALTPPTLAPQAAADVAMVSSDNERRRRRSPGRQRRLEELRIEFERRTGFGAGMQQVVDWAHFRLTRPSGKAVVLGLDAPSGGVSHEHSLKLSPKSSGQKNTTDKLTLNKRKSQGPGGKRKPSVNKRRAHAVDPEESDYESSLPSRFSNSRKQQVQNLSSVYSRKVQDVVLLDDEDMEPKQEVNFETSDRLNESKIYYPSRDDQEAVEVTRSDIKCLDPEVFLSSPVINFYIKYIKRTRLCNQNFGDKFYIFNTYFFGKLEEAMYEQSDFRKLRRWWKGANIFTSAYIILPIHAKEHWSLVIICLPPKERISEPIILHLDSLGMHRSTKILNIVGRYLEKEWHFLAVADPSWPCLLNDIRKEIVKVPQQNNAYDCGIFMLYYIEQFIKEAPARFTADKLDMFSRSWFRPEEASGLNLRMRELLLEEFESVRLDDPISKANASEGYEGIKDRELEARDSSKMVVEVGVGFRNTKKEGKSIAIAPQERLKGNENMGSTPISEGNEEFSDSMPVPDAVCEITGTKLWIKRVYRPPITLPLDNWYRSRGRSSRDDDDRRAFIEQFCRK